MLWRAGSGARLGGAMNLWLRHVKGFNVECRDHVLIPPTRRVTGVDFGVVRSPVPAEDEDMLLGLPAVTATRALIGAAATYHPARIRVAFDAARAGGLTSEALILARLGALGDVHGAPQMRRIARTGRLANDSEPERDLAEVFGVDDPQPAAQVWVCWHGRWFRLDLAFLNARLALEYDGEDHAQRRERNADRDLALMELDIATIRVTKSMMRDVRATRRRILVVYRQRSALGLPPIVPQLPPWLWSRGENAAPPCGVLSEQRAGVTGQATLLGLGGRRRRPARR